MKLVRRGLHEDGFGLVELLIAMTILAVAGMALLAGFTSGTLSLVRSARASTGATLADKQLELYRGLPYSGIVLDAGQEATAASDATYAGDPALAGSPTKVTGACPGASADQVTACNPMQTISGASSPDGRSYRIDTYIVLDQPDASARNVKKVTVVVRDVGDGYRVLARQISTFDELAG